jgi:hypothetical protein
VVDSTNRKELIDMQPTFDLTTARELDARANDGVEVRLLWHPSSDRIGVEVLDSRTGEQFALAVHAADALDAFNHPFAYAGRDEQRRPSSRRQRSTQTRSRFTSDDQEGGGNVDTIRTGIARFASMLVIAAAALAAAGRWG